MITRSEVSTENIGQLEQQFKNHTMKKHVLHSTVSLENQLRT